MAWRWQAAGSWAGLGLGLRRLHGQASSLLWQRQQEPHLQYKRNNHRHQAEMVTQSRQVLGISTCANGPRQAGPHSYSPVRVTLPSGSTTVSERTLSFMVPYRTAAVPLALQHTRGGQVDAHG